MRKTLSFLILLGLCFPVAAQYTEDKSKFLFFNPTPRDLMRTMTTDISGRTWSPFTVDAGRLQFESVLASAHFIRVNDTLRLTHFEALNNNFKYGITNFLDVEFLFNTAMFYRNRPIGNQNYHYEPEWIQHMGARGKINFFGNDEGPFALATVVQYDWRRFGRDDLPLLGVAFPGRFQVNEMLSVSAMLAAYNERNQVYSQQMVKGEAQLSQYTSIWAELYNSGSPIHAMPATTTFNLGFKQRAFEHYLFTTGAYLGLSEPAERFVLFGGIAARF